MLFSFFLLSVIIALGTASPLAPLLSNSTALAINSPPINLDLYLENTDLVLVVRSHIPSASALDTNVIPGFITAASLDLYAYVHEQLPARGGAAAHFERVYSFRSRTTGYRILWWGAPYREAGISYEDLMVGTHGLMRVASGLYEEVDLGLGHVGGERGLSAVAGRIYMEGRGGEDGDGGVDVT